MLAPLMEFDFSQGTQPNIGGNSSGVNIIMALRGLETPIVHLIWLLAILLAPLALH